MRAACAALTEPSVEQVCRSEAESTEGHKDPVTYVMNVESSEPEEQNSSAKEWNCSELTMNPGTPAERYRREANRDDEHPAIE